MSLATARLVRLLTVVVFVAVAFVGYRAFDPEDPVAIEEPRAGELDVAHAINGFEDRPVTVRGHVFEGPGGLGLRICQGRRNTAPPLCLGPFLDLDGVTRGSFAMKSGETDGGLVRWADRPLALRGTISGTRMSVSAVLG